MTDTAYAIYLPLIFPAGLSSGESSDGNLLTIARDGQGRPVLRGTAIAGVLRNAWKKMLNHETAQPHPDVEAIFGASQGARDSMLRPSALIVPDCPVGGATPGASLSTRSRTHNLINRHTGAVIDKGLFNVETLPPHCTLDLTLWLVLPDELSALAERFISDIAALLEAGLIFGGRSARGIGRATLREKALVARYNLAQADSHADFLDHQWHWRLDPHRPPSNALPVPSSSVVANRLTINLLLQIPRGQDLLVGGGRGGAKTDEPQIVADAAGREYWLLPGATLRGVLHGWISRLAAREGMNVAFSNERFLDIEDANLPIKPVDIAWGFIPEDKRCPGADIPCVILSLFGSLARRGRIFISDSHCPVKPEHRQYRQHVVIDRISGGAIEGLLFANDVLISPADSRVMFPVTITIENPTADEARWLAQSIQALDLGVLRIGSSKAAGRLALAGPPQADGPHADLFRNLKPSVPCEVKP